MKSCSACGATRRHEHEWPCDESDAGVEILRLEEERKALHFLLLKFVVGTVGANYETGRKRSYFEMTLPRIRVYKKWKPGLDVKEILLKYLKERVRLGTPTMGDK